MTSDDVIAVGMVGAPAVGGADWLPSRGGRSFTVNRFFLIIAAGARDCAEAKGASRPVEKARRVGFDRLL
jgi:hypothetical protein